MSHVGFENGNFTVDLTNLWSSFSQWTWVDWVFAILVVDAIYGAVAHWHSLPAIHRWNEKNSNKQISNGVLVFMFFARIYFGLPLRLLFFFIGTFEFVGSLFACGSLSYEIWKDAVHWHQSPKEVHSIFSS